MSPGTSGGDGKHSAAVVAGILSSVPALPLPVPPIDISLSACAPPSHVPLALPSTASSLLSTSHPAPGRNRNGKLPRTRNGEGNSNSKSKSDSDSYRNSKSKSQHYLAERGRVITVAMRTRPEGTTAALSPSSGVDLASASIWPNQSQHVHLTRAEREHAAWLASEGLWVKDMANVNLNV